MSTWSPRIDLVRIDWRPTDCDRVSELSFFQCFPLSLPDTAEEPEGESITVGRHAGSVKHFFAELQWQR